MQNTGSIEIDRPIEEVFRLANEHIAEWSNVVVEDEAIDEKPEGVGTTFRTVTEESGARLEFQGVVTQHEPPFASAVRLVGEPFDIDTSFRFEDLGGRTRVTQQATVTGKGYIKLLMFLAGPFVRKSNCKAQNDELESLKRYCENFAGE